MPHTLLLADDSVTIQRVIELTFAEEDVDVVAVSDGDQAIKRLESAPPDIVLADIGMPGRDGYEVARYIRQTPKLSHIPVVLLTGAFEPVDHAKVAEVGCDGVLAKPFEPQLVIGRVKELLSGAPRPASKPAEAAVVPESEAAAPATTAAAPAQNLDDYFDKLDTAFANMTGSGAPAQSDRSTASPGPERPDRSEPSVADQIDSFAALHTTPPTSEAELPLSQPSPAPAAEEHAAAELAAPAPQASMAPAPAPAPVVLRPAPPAPARELPSVADAFAAILAAEQADSGTAVAPLWPASAASAPPAAGGEISDDVIEQIVQRVLARISVGDRVADIAERLVREEIERIKASIR